MLEKKHLLVIVNPISGVKAKMNAIEFLKEGLSERFEYEVVLTKRPKHATKLAKKALKQNLDGVIVLGGDGSINEVAKVLVNSDIPLGIIPFGSGNGFARHLNIPLQVQDAIQVINRFKIKKIDTACINKIPFVATAGMGFDEKVSRKFAKYGKRGFLSYSQIAINEFFNFKPKEYELVIDGELVKKTAFIVVFANVGQYGNNAWIAPSASVLDGKINVCILEPFPPQMTPDIIFRLFNKTIEGSKYFSTFLAEEVIVKKPRKFHMDGEPKKKKSEMIVKVVPNSLAVIC